MDRYKIIICHQEGYSGEKIQQSTEISIDGMHYMIKKIKKNSQIEDRPRGGRLKITDKPSEHYLVVASLRSKKKSGRDLASNLNELRGISVNNSRVRRVLLKKYFRRCVAKRKPSLRKNNHQRRLYFAQAHKAGTAEQ
jgi:transposase